MERIRYLFFIFGVFLLGAGMVLAALVSISKGQQSAGTAYIGLGGLIIAICFVAFKHTGGKK